MCDFGPGEKGGQHVYPFAVGLGMKWYTYQAKDEGRERSATVFSELEDDVVHHAVWLTYAKLNVTEEVFCKVSDVLGIEYAVIGNG